MTLYEILIPVCDNGGVEFDAEHNAVWEDNVLDIAGGLTTLPVVNGQWSDPDGHAIREEMKPVRIACSEEQINDIADMTASHYKQLSIMYYTISTDVIFKNYEQGR